MIEPKKTRRKKSRGGRVAADISLEDLEEWFHLPSDVAATKLGISGTLLKRVCRRLGIPRWPYRKVTKAERVQLEAGALLFERRQTSPQSHHHQQQQPSPIPGMDRSRSMPHQPHHPAVMLNRAASAGGVSLQQPPQPLWQPQHLSSLHRQLPALGFAEVLQHTQAVRTTTTTTTTGDLLARGVSESGFPEPSASLATDTAKHLWQLLQVAAFAPSPPTHHTAAATTAMDEDRVGSVSGSPTARHQPSEEHNHNHLHPTTQGTTSKKSHGRPSSSAAAPIQVIASHGPAEPPSPFAIDVSGYSSFNSNKNNINAAAAPIGSLNGAFQRSSSLIKPKAITGRPNSFMSLSGGDKSDLPQSTWQQLYSGLGVDAAGTTLSARTSQEQEQGYFMQPNHQNQSFLYPNQQIKQQQHASSSSPTSSRDVIDVNFENTATTTNGATSQSQLLDLASRLLREGNEGLHLENSMDALKGMMTSVLAGQQSDPNVAGGAKMQLLASFFRELAKTLEEDGV